MATSLYLITNSKLTGKETLKDWDRIASELYQLQLGTTSIVNEQNRIIKEYGGWTYEIEPQQDGVPFNVDFGGPYHIQPNLFSNIGVIYTIYKYSLLYQNFNLEWFQSFRNDLYKIVEIMGGTEVIYLADNGCDKLSKYLELMAWDNVPYHEIKAKMFEVFGEPVTDYSKLNYDKLTYDEIDEFFFDDFNDLKLNG